MATESSLKMFKNAFYICIKSNSHLPKRICLIESLLKMIKNAFYFIFKSSFRSLDIEVFVMTFWTCRKNGLIRKIRLTSKFITSQPGQQTIAIHILPNISLGNQKMKLGQLIEYNKRNIFLSELFRK